MPRNNRNRRGALPKQGAGGAGYQGGRGCAPQTQQGGRGGGDDGGGRGRGGVPQHQQQQQPQHYGSPPEYQGRGGGPSSGGPASRAPKPSPADLIQQLLQSSVEQNKGIPRPPGKATAGRKCTVKANHFFAELPYKDLHQYDVTITPEVTLRRVNYDVMKQLVKLYRVSELGNRLPAYDGLKNLYTAGPLPFASKEFNITLDDEDGSGGQRCRGDREFLVEIKSVDAPADLRYLGLFLVGRQADPPQEALQAFNMALREVPTSRYGNMGPSFYPPMFGLKQDLGGGLESWQGFHQSIRPTQMGLSLNIDVSTTAFIAPQPVIKFVTKLLNWDISASSLSASSLSVADCKKIENALRGVKVEATHYEDMHIKYRISGLTDLPTERVTFPLDAKGKLISVVDYFRDKYDMKIKLTQWPCFKVGNQLRPKYLPMEVCQIVEGQRYNNMLNESQTTAIVNSSLQCPKEREKDILQTVHNNAYHDDPYVKEFGMKISDELASVEARILSAPSLRYRDDRGTAMDFQPEVGRWNMKHKKLYNGGRVDNWICIIFSEDVSVWMARRFCYSLAAMCKAKGMQFAPEPLLHHVTAEPEQVERALKDLYLDAMAKLQPQGKKLDLLIVILPDIKGSLYGDLKRICETDLGLVSQCCLSKHVFQMEKAYLENMSLKINVKVGGQNTVLVDALSECLPLVGNLPTIFFGADVTHPHPGDKSNPSIAAVVASQDWPDMTKYAGLVCAQAHRQELIEDLYKTCEDPVRGLVGGGMIKELLDSFHNSTGLWPSRIIFYRDGVGEGQFGQVLDNELRAIYKACASISDDYIPLVTFVVVQKRHHTKLFANNHGDRSTVDCGGNILPGTVVDSTICHPTNFDFYLCSHSTPKGTSRPAHYHVLWDTNKFTADALQLLTNHLCYTFARCTQSVSIVPPVYYAHLLAARARFYVEPKTVGGPSVNAAVRPLSALKENVKRVMFYC